VKTVLKGAVLGALFGLMLLVEAPPQAPFAGLQLMPQAHAAPVHRVARRTARRTAVVVSSAQAAGDAEAAQQVHAVEPVQ
jgi:hypothetical protein